MELDEDVVLAVHNKAEGKSAFGLSGLLGKGAAKRKMEELYVLGKPPETQEDWKHAHEYILLQYQFREYVVRWNSVAPELSIECFETVEPGHAIKAAEYFSLHKILRQHIEMEAQVIRQCQILLPAWRHQAEISQNFERLKELQRLLENHVLRYRLAIECDGDRYHGIDRWDDDMHRQRILERVGWQFWRCFASSFVKNRQDVLDDLIAILSQRGIDPIGSESVPRSLHTEHRRVTAFPPLEGITSPMLTEDFSQIAAI